MYYALIEEAWGDPRKKPAPAAPRQHQQQQQQQQQQQHPPPPQASSQASQAAQTRSALAQAYATNGFDSVWRVLPEGFVDQMRERLAAPRTLSITFTLQNLASFLMFALLALMLYDVSTRLGW